MATLPAPCALLLVLAAASVVAASGGPSPASEWQAEWQGGAAAAAATAQQEDDSVRCRLSGICEGTAVLERCRRRQLGRAGSGSSGGSSSGGSRSGSAGSFSDPGDARDAELACITDPAERAERVRQAALWAWQAYSACAWGEDELRPLSCSGQHWLNLSLTMVDSLSTLHLMGLHEQFDEAASWLAANLDLSAPGHVNLFETTIRVLGGLLSAHHLAQGRAPAAAAALAARAAELGARMAPAFSSPSGIPYSDVSLRTGDARSPAWAKVSSLSEVSTLSLEWTYLARLTNHPEFERLALGVHSVLAPFVNLTGGLLPLYFSPDAATHGQQLESARAAAAASREEEEAAAAAASEGQEAAATAEEETAAAAAAGREAAVTAATAADGEGGEAMPEGGDGRRQDVQGRQQQEVERPDEGRLQEAIAAAAAAGKAAAGTEQRQKAKPRRAGAVPGGGAVTLGARADSYYEYLLKQWLLTGKSQDWLRQRYVQAMRGVRRRLLRSAATTDASTDSSSSSSSSSSSPAIRDNNSSVGSSDAVSSAAGGAAGGARGSQLWYVGEEGADGRPSPKMDHLVCFLPGLLALGDLHGVSTRLADEGATRDAPAATAADGAAGGGAGGGSSSSSAGNLGAQAASEVAPAAAWDPTDLELAHALAATCAELYRQTPAGLAPEIAHFAARGDEFPKHHSPDVGRGAFAIKPADAHSLLRPEAVESFYLLWKVTGDPQYREWAWAVFRALERWGRVEEEALEEEQHAALQGRREEQQEMGADCGSQVRHRGAGMSEPQPSAVSGQGQQLGSAAAAAGGSTDGASSSCSTTPASTIEQRQRVGVVDSERRRGRGGYSSLSSVLEVPPPRRDKMESFFLSETLKYLYLIFADSPDRCLHPSCAAAAAAGGGEEEEGPGARSQQQLGRRQQQQESAGSGSRPGGGGRVAASAAARKVLDLRSVVLNTEAHPLPVVGPSGASLVAPLPGLDPSLLRPFAGAAGGAGEAEEGRREGGRAGAEAAAGAAAGGSKGEGAAAEGMGAAEGTSATEGTGAPEERRRSGRDEL